MHEPFTENPPTGHAGQPRGSLLELALLFLRLGSTAIGGPAVHIAMMEEEVVTRRRWLTRAEFLDFLGATNLIPGPNSTEMAIHVGRVRAGWRGLLVAGVSFILPAALMVGCLAWAYVRYGALPQIAALLYGVKPVVIVVIAQGALRLGRSAVKSVWLAVLGGLAVIAAALGVDALLVLFAAGALAGAVHLRSRFRSANLAAGALGAGGGISAAGAAVVPFSLTLLFLVLLKIGATLFGGGYVLVAFLRSDLVARLGWLSERQLLDAVAVGQVTPGPLFTTATFVGYVLGGVPGAVLGTVAIFLPAFVLVAISGPLVLRLRRSSTAGAVLDGINVAALALMVVVSAQRARSAIVDWFTLGLAALGAVLLLRYRVNSAWLVLGAAIAGGTMVWLGVVRLARESAKNAGETLPAEDAEVSRRARRKSLQPQRSQRRAAKDAKRIRPLGRFRPTVSRGREALEEWRDGRGAHPASEPRSRPARTQGLGHRESGWGQVSCHGAVESASNEVIAMMRGFMAHK